MPTKNTVVDLNNLLFEQLERLMYPEDDEDIDKIIRVSKAVSDTAKNIIDNHKNVLEAMKLQNKQEGYADDTSAKIMLGIKNGEN